MTTQFREALTDVIESVPAIRVPADLFDKGQRRRRRKRIVSALSVLLVVASAAMFGSITRDRQAVEPATPEPDNRLSTTVKQAPKWLADIRDAPLDRAYIAYDERDEDRDGTRLVLIGSGDRYRSFASGGMLSPDGTHLVYGGPQNTSVLNISSGAVIQLGSGAPVAWSRDGRFIVLTGNTGIGSTRFEGTVVEAQTGEVAWRFEHNGACSGPTISMSPDNSAVAVGCWSTGTSVYGRGEGLRWSQPERVVAGPQAWTPDGAAVTTHLVRNFISYNGVYLLDAATGKPTGEVDVLDYLNRAAAPFSLSGGWTVDAWHAGLPVLVSSDEAFRLSGVSTFFAKLHYSGTRLQIASSVVDWSSVREQGPLDAGPFPERYLDALPYVYAAWVFVLLAVIVVWVRRRRRR